MEQSSSFVQHQPFQLSLLCSEFQLSLLHHDGEKGARTKNEEDRVAAKSKPTTMNLTSTVSTSSPSVNHPIASHSPGILKASTRALDARARRNSKPDAASSSQGRLKDAYVGGLLVGVTGRLVATVKSQESCEFSESESWSDHETKCQGNLVPRVVCYLHHFAPKYRRNLMQKVYRSENQIHKRHRLITHKEKARCQFRLEILKL